MNDAGGRGLVECLHGLDQRVLGGLGALGGCPLATRMRLSQQTTYDAKKKKPGAARKPWEG